MRAENTPRNVTDYIATAPKEVQVRLKQIRAAIKEVAPDATEFISYGMPAYKYDRTFIGFAAMKNHIGLYPFTGSFVAAHQKELAGYATSKSAIRLPLDKQLPIDLIKNIVKLRLKETEEKSISRSGPMKGHFMTVENRFSQHYKEGWTPWDIGKPDSNLIQAVTTIPIVPCNALDIGCGTGDNAIWMSEHHFDVTGIDISGIAIDRAKQKATKTNAKTIFHVLDILTSQVEEAPFGFAFDRGCFHVMDSDEQRKRFAENVSRHLTPGGLWLSLIGNADQERHGEGPPQRTARDIVNAVEPHFEILSLVSGNFETNLPEQPRAWICLMRKRSSR